MEITSTETAKAEIANWQDSKYLIISVNTLEKENASEIIEIAMVDSHGVVCLDTPLEPKAHCYGPKLESRLFDYGMSYSDLTGAFSWLDTHEAIFSLINDQYYDYILTDDPEKLLSGLQYMAILHALPFDIPKLTPAMSSIVKLASNNPKISNIAAADSWIMLRICIFLRKLYKTVNYDVRRPRDRCMAIKDLIETF